MQLDVVSLIGFGSKKIVDIEEQMCYNTMNRLNWIIMLIYILVTSFYMEVLIWRKDSEKSDPVPLVSGVGSVK